MSAPIADAVDPRPGHRRGRAALRVLMIVESSGAGTGRHVLDLTGSLMERGCDVHLIYSPTRVDRLFLNRLAQLPKLRHIAVPMRTAPHPSDLAALQAIRRYMHRAGPFDLIHGHSSKGGALARLATVGTRIPAFYTPHGLVTMDPQLARWKWLFYLSVELGLSFQTARIIAVSPEELRSAVQSGFGRERVIMVPNGVRPGELTPRAHARLVLEVDGNTVVIGFVGRLVEQKAPDVLVRAFAAAVGANQNVRLAMIGGGPLDESLRVLARDLKLTDKIIWLGERDARGVMAGFDIFALASRKEGLPYVVLEAMTAGLPVVATTTSGVEILVTPGVNGSVVATDDVAALGTSLAELTSDAKRRASYGQASRKMAAQFTVELMTDRTLDAYHSQVRGLRAP
jgi:glycosyltransferase involved in cell wall biosynthesis